MLFFAINVIGQNTTSTAYMRRLFAIELLLLFGK